MTFNSAGLNLIKTYENCVLTAYKDLAGTVTIGWGTTGQDIVPGLYWTQEQADKALEEDLHYIQKVVDKMLTIQLDDNQYSAVIALAYNIGCGALMHSTLISLINSGKFEEAAEEFLLWDHTNGIVIPGLLRRREAERDLFLTPQV